MLSFFHYLCKVPTRIIADFLLDKDNVIAIWSYTLNDIDYRGSTNFDYYTKGRLNCTLNQEKLEISKIKEKNAF